jgi:hypothetical protein
MENLVFVKNVENQYAKTVVYVLTNNTGGKVWAEQK